MQQAKEQGPARLKQVEDLRKNDPQAFSVMIMEFREKSLILRGAAV